MSSLSLETSAPVAAISERSPGNSYGQILKSSAWIGGSAVLNIGVGILRTKALALLLGPAGFGLNGLYSSIADLAQSIAGMGVNSSGVRQIAAAAGSGDRERVAETAAVLRQTSRVLGVAGALLVALFAAPISKLTFGTSSHWAAVCLLSLAVCFKLVSNGQSALIQGMRRIADLARMNFLGAVFGTIFSIPLVYFFGQNGIVPALVAVAGMSVLTSWWYSRKIEVPVVQVRPSAVRQEAAALLKLGFAFMLSGFLTMGAAYVVRVLLLRTSGATGTGLYQAAWTLGGLYAGIVLQAMGADFYPRLTAQASDNRQVNRLVNEQTLAGLLLAAPGVLVTMTMAPLILFLFYSGKFDGAAAILRWISLGTLFQVISWPMGFIALAKGRQNIFLVCDLLWGAVYLALAWFLIGRFGNEGAGMAFAGAYLFHAVLNYAVAQPLSDFRFSREFISPAIVLLSAVGLVLAVYQLLASRVALGLGLAVTAAAALYSLRLLLTTVPLQRMPRAMQRLLQYARLLPAKRI